MLKIKSVSSSEFAGKFGQWSFNAQQAPVKVVNNKTGVVAGYFISAQEFDAFWRLRKYLPQALYASELDGEVIEALQAPLPKDYPELEDLMKE